MSRPDVSERLEGLAAEFSAAEDLVHAIRKTREAGYTSYDAFSPYPLEEFTEAMGVHHSRVPRIVFAGGVLGALCGWALQYWISVIAFPLNVGGRPYDSWPAFIVVIFEMTILFAGFAAVLGMFFVNGLPKPYHPLFHVDRFALATRDRFFLYIEARDPRFDHDRTWDFLESLNPTEVNVVED
jgi:hypothetical protein